jgi:hypothetical protein
MILGGMAVVASLAQSCILLGGFKYEVQRFETGLGQE